MADVMEKEIGWDEEIENEGGGFTLLKEGDYDFEVVEFKRGRHNGSAKMPACNKAMLKLRVSGGGKSTTIEENLFLHSKVEWKLCQFFRSIGLKVSGEKVRMDWSRVPGAKGRCHVIVEKWKGNDDKERESNRVSEFYDAPSATVAPAKGFKAGAF